MNLRAKGIYNVVESFLQESLTNYLIDHPELCSCGVCKADIVALSLTRLPAYYVSTRQGEELIRQNLRVNADEIKRVLNESVRIVSQNPHREDVTMTEYAVVELFDISSRE